MRVLFHSLYQQKEGNDPQEYEDYWGILDKHLATGYLPSKFFDNIVTQESDFAPAILEQDFLSVALADGATESIFSREWARLLVDEFNDSSSTSLEALKRNVTRSLRVWKRITRSRPLPWYAEEKVKLGAFCTFLGIKLSPINSVLGELNAIALGDSCLFQIRGKTLTECFPFITPEEFGNNPGLLSTNPQYNERVWPAIVRHRGFWKTGDMLLLMTDALAQWFMRRVMEGEEPWNTLALFTEEADSEQFTQWVGKLRESKLIKNDDVTLLVLRVLENEIAQPG